MSWFEGPGRRGNPGPALSRVCAPRLFGGLLLDVRRKAPHYLSDYSDAFSLQCLASLLFLYCACMSPVITFGGLLGEATEGRIVRLRPYTTRHHHGDSALDITMETLP